MGRLDELEHVQLTSRRAWRAWLAEHHLTSPGIWLVTFKAQRGRPRLAYDEIVEEALCFGWIDSRPGKVDAERTKILVTPRKPRSVWSRANKQRIARLEAAGLIAPRGLEVLAAARQSGAWDALSDSDALLVPGDLAAALDAAPRARGHFEAFPPSARRAILEWIYAARRPETRARRVAETARLAARNERANVWRPKDQPAAPPKRARGKVK